MIRPRPSGALSRRSALGALGAVPLVAATVSAAPAAASVSCAATGAVPADLRPGGSFDRYVARLAAQDDFSGSLLITHRGRTVLSRAYGEADKRLSIPNRVETVFALASVTKLFTGLAVVQLAQRGKVDVTRTLGTYLDGFPADIADTVTVHELLVHTSGMGDFMQDADYPAASAKWTSAGEVMDGTMAFIRKAPLRFTPGSQYGYSNSGYVVLGAIVAAVSGLSYYEYVRKNIFAAAGMTDSDFCTSLRWKTNRRIAHPYALQPSGDRADTVDNQVFIGCPAGSAFATAPDMVRFAHALLDGKLLAPAFTELYAGGKHPMPPPQGTPDPSRQEAFTAYGPLASIYNGRRIVSGNGGGTSPTIGGITTSIDIYADLDWTAVILSNYDQVDLATLMSKVRHAITDHLA